MTAVLNMFSTIPQHERNQFDEILDNLLLQMGLALRSEETANNIVAIAGDRTSIGQTFHVVRDELETMEMITNIIAQRTGITFQMFDLPAFVPQVIRRCTRADPLYPLLDFLVGSVESISSMEFKRYQSTVYQVARDRLAVAQPDPPLDVVVDGVLRFLKRRGLL